MTRAEQFVAALQKKAGAQGPDGVREYWEQQRNAWTQDLTALCASCESWLAPAVAANAVKLLAVKYSTTEPDLGTYMAPGLRIDLLVDPPVSVEVRPRGCNVVGLVQPGGKPAVGAQGRVDIERGVEREILLRFKDEAGTKWFSFSGGEQRELGQDVFLELLSRVAGLELDEP